MRHRNRRVGTLQLADTVWSALEVDSLSASTGIQPLDTVAKLDWISSL